MCGILGIVASPGETLKIGEHQVLRMRDAMQSRGPDAAGYFHERNVALAHRRLAIRDREGGHQPWLSEDRQCALVYNGEIYNDRQLRQELTALGHRFRSRCDTEVVLAAYRQWGTDCLHRLRGMFAFGIYDFRDESLFLARDRFGIKPLFLAEIDGTLVFASSLPALLLHPKLSKKPNFSTLSHYLTTFRITLGRETLFSGIQQLLPGEFLHWQGGTFHVERYWNYPLNEDDSWDYGSATDCLLEELKAAVEMRLLSDVPVGMFLSGGVDSNTIACLLRDSTSRSVLGQCGGGEADSRESHDFSFARRCAKHVEFDYGEVRLDPEDYLETWQWMLEQYETPLSTPSDVILYRLAEEMKKSVGVVLGGEGADELLCGYAVQHWSGNDFDRSRQLATGNWRAGPATARIFRGSLLRQYGTDRFASAVDHYFALNSLIPRAVKPALFQPWAWREAGQDQPTWDYYRRRFAQFETGSTSRKQTAILHSINLETLLARLDSATMLSGLEARVPYTDHRLVEKMFQVPYRFKIDVAEKEQAPWLASGELEQRGSLQSKQVLRTVAQRLMPADLALRKKASFPTPVSPWLSGPWKQWIREKLLTSPFGRAVFQPGALQELADNLPQAGMWVWPLTNALAWGDRHFGGN